MDHFAIPTSREVQIPQHLQPSAPLLSLLRLHSTLSYLRESTLGMWVSSLVMPIIG